MSNPRREVVRGQRIESLPHEAWNDFLRASQQVRLDQSSGVRDASLVQGGGPTIRIRNDTGTDLSTGGIVAFSTPLFGEVENLTEFQFRPNLKGILPTTPPDINRFGIALTPIQSSGAGYVMVSGAIAVKVLVTDITHGFAVPIAGNVSYMQSNGRGGAVLLHQPTVTGLQWCLVLLGACCADNFTLAGTGSGSGSNVIGDYITSPCCLGTSVKKQLCITFSGDGAPPSLVGVPIDLANVHSNIGWSGGSTSTIHDNDPTGPYYLSVIVRCGVVGGLSQWQIFVCATRTQTLTGGYFDGQGCFGWYSQNGLSCGGGIPQDTPLGTVSCGPPFSATGSYLCPVSGQTVNWTVSDGPCTGNGISWAPLGTATGSPATIASVTLEAGTLLIVTLVGTQMLGAVSGITVTFAGTSMTLDASASAPLPVGPSPDGKTRVYSLAVSTQTTGDIVATCSSKALKIQAIEVVGLTSNVADKSKTATGAASTPDSGATGTTTTANEFVIAVCGMDTPGTLGAWTNGYITTNQDVTSGTVTSKQAYRILSATGTVDAALASGAPTSWAMVTVTYK